MGVQWTEEQQKVIDLRERNILVSAAAGSGKTAVLVERIIQRLMDKVRPLDVDKLLIVTFTDAAAAEMKERIRNAIENALEEEPENVHLQRQSTLIHSAPITTIHSFCMSVMREHFHVIDLDPGFRTGEEGELKLLRQDVLDEMLEGAYAEGRKEFLEFVEKFGTGRSDKKIEELILTLYEYSRSYPQPDKWLESCVDAYRMENERIDDASFFNQIKKYVHQYMDDAQAVLWTAVRICEEPDGPYMYEEALKADLTEIRRIWDTEHFEEMYSAVGEIAWKRLSTKKDEGVSAEKKDAVKGLREKVKKMIKSLQSSYFYETPEELVLDMKRSYASMEVLINLVRQFAGQFGEKKKSRNLIDFSDMEQLALQILTDEVEGKLVPSASAKEYQDKFSEVMIDEYQDSNLIQEAILTSVSTVSRGKPNIFMVGDVKQSIYRFRLSRPELFMEKYDTYSLTDGKNQRIDLHKNFRSRSEVLDSTNFVFRQVMQKDIGGVAYDAQAALYPGADYPESPEQDGISDNRTELLLLDTSGVPEDKLEDLPEETLEQLEIWDGTPRQMEAKAVAKRIKELVKSGLVVDRQTKEYRPVKYGDIVILTRSMKGWADVFASVLAEEGIPAYVGSREGYFETYEVSILLDYLQVLDNERQDLPLTAVLTSPFAGLNAGELARIRSACRDLPFYEAVRSYASGTEMGTGKEKEKETETENENETEKKDAGIQKKLQRFLNQIEHYRERLPFTAMHDLLWNIMEETGYGDYIAAMPGGEQRFANLEMLVEKAAAYEGTSYKGLFNFVRYIEQLKKYDVDYGEASISDEQDNTVRIMTIHKSKGLEFPIVFVAGMGKRFNTQDVTGSIVIHPELGVGVDAVDLDRRTKAPTLLKKIIQEAIRVENLGEEMRVLYVAMTRAKEKLILTGECREAQKLLAEYEKREEAVLPFYQRLGARSYLDWVLPAAMGEGSPIEVSLVECWEQAKEEAVEERASELAKDVLLHWDYRQIHDEQFKARLEERLNYVYPYTEEGCLKMKFTVSELKKRAYLAEEAGEVLYEEPEIVPLLPRFLEEGEGLTGASRGSAYHKLLELLDFTKAYSIGALQEEIQELVRSGRLSGEMADCIRYKDIIGFLESGIGHRMREAAGRNQLHVEQPFVLGVEPQEIYPETDSWEPILVQGIIDVYFEEEDGLVLLDYKTDRVRSGRELTERYRAQLDYYAQALEQLLCRPVKEKVIYSFAMGEEIQI